MYSMGTVVELEPVGAGTFRSEPEPGAGAGAAAGEKQTRSRSKTDRLRNTDVQGWAKWSYKNYCK